MKHFVLHCILITLFVTSCSCSQEVTEPIPYVPENTGYVPQPIEDPFPEYVPPEIDTSDFTLNNIPVNFTAVNDFHGQVDEEGEDNRVGLAKMAKYLKGRKEKGDVLISNGDMYQGSYFASTDKGQFISYAFKNMGFDAYVLGNHEFDWGVNPILDNQAALGQNFLCANLYQYPKRYKDWEKASLGDKYKIINLYEGTPYEVKIGVIGVIGKAQISSITSLYTENYIFLDPTSIVKEIALDLRENKKCDFVIASYHDGDPDESIASTVKNKTYRYVDACFMAHTHRYEKKLVNDVPFIQASAYSRGVSSINFSFDKTKKQITLDNYEYTYLASKGLVLDPIMDQKITEKKATIKEAYETVIGTNEATDTDYAKMSQFYAKVSYDKAKTLYKDYHIVGCMFNEARRDLKSGDFTYADLFETNPFENGIYIFTVKGEDILNEKKYSYGYIDPNVTISTFGEKYNILVYDYNGFHIGIKDNYDKYYNYFPSAFVGNPTPEHLKVEFNCLEAATEYLRDSSVINDNFFADEGFYARTA